MVMAGLTLSLSTAAFADGFVNGGFETGDFSGWTQGAGAWGGGWPINPTDYRPGGSQYIAAYNASAIVTPGTDPLTGNNLNTVYAGNYSARINDSINNYSVSTVYQQVLNYTDPDMYFEWAAVLQASHDSFDSDNFTLQLTDDTTHTVILNRAYNSADNGSIFTYNPFSGAYYTDWQVEHIDLEALGIQGHDFTLELLASDCPYGGHWGYVYLDGFAPTVVPPGDDVPEPASMLLLGSGGVALLARARRRRVTQ
jgi:hypothetical protein